MNQTELKAVNQFLLFMENNNPSKIARILAEKGSEHQITEFKNSLNTFQNYMVSVEAIFILHKAQAEHQKNVEKHNELIKEMNKNGHKSGVLFGKYLKVV